MCARAASSAFSGQVTDVKSDWKEPDEDARAGRPQQSLRRPLHVILHQAPDRLGIVFCAARRRRRRVSSSSTARTSSPPTISRIAISGPVSISAGSPLSLDITVTNKNNVDLQAADLARGFPGRRHRSWLTPPSPSRSSSRETCSATYAPGASATEDRRRRDLRRREPPESRSPPR
jgi:hypothetical protein